MLRVERPRDSRAVAALLARTITAGQPATAWDPERLTRIIERLYRWDARAVVRLSAGIGRPVPRTFVEETDGSIRGAVAWTPGRRVGWVAALGVDPDGTHGDTLARLLDRCWAETRRHHFDALVVPGSLVPGGRDPPGSLDALGFVSLGAHRRYLLEEARFPEGSPGMPRPRPFRRRDAEHLVPSARGGRLPGLEAIEPVRAADLGVSGWVARALGSTTAAFVHDGSEGADAYVRATRSSAASTAHLSIVLDPHAPRIAGRSALLGALSWCRRRGARRAVAEAPEGAGHLAALLGDAGFGVLGTSETWARPVDGAS